MMKLDFEEDLRRDLIETSNAIGFKLNNQKRLYEILLDYLTVRAKWIEKRRRIVLINPLFKNEIVNHPKNQEIQFIIQAAANGKNLNKFQSKRLLQTNFHDHLQNEWNIYHFHLSLKKEKKSKFVKQGTTLLFAYIDNDHIAFLGTETHKEGVFADPKWIEILHDFHPELIASFRDNSFHSVDPSPNALELQTLWNKGYSVGMTEVRGVVYSNPGIGRMTTGHSVKNAKTAMEITRWLHELTEQVKELYNSLCDELNINPIVATFGIRLGEAHLELYEGTTNQILLVFPQLFFVK